MKRGLLSLALLAALPFAASAADLSYTYIEGGYSHFNSAPDADGLIVNGSYALNDNFHVFGGYGSFGIDRTPVDLDTFDIGLGYRYGLSGNTDLVVRGTYENAVFDKGVPNVDVWSAEAGVRSALTSNVEGWAFAGYEDSDVANGDAFAKLGAQVKLNPQWGLVAEVKFINGDQQYFVGPRLSF